MSTVSAPSITMVNVPTSCRPQYIQGFGARSYIRAVGTVMPESSHCPSTAFVATVFPLLHQECLARPRPPLGILSRLQRSRSPVLALKARWSYVVRGGPLHHLILRQSVAPLRPFRLRSRAARFETYRSLFTDAGRGLWRRTSDCSDTPVLGATDHPQMLLALRLRH